MKEDVTFQKLVDDYVKANPDFAANLLPDTQTALALALSRSYEILHGELRNTIG
ncbi:MAG: hypothetical protein JST14_03410, partial [Bacteroidetes bacterium]|nr:hypothetical protein [Bacteroidota bacterium]